MRPDDGRSKALTVPEAIEMNRKLGEFIGFPSYSRLFFGQKLPEAIKNGYQITQRGFFEAAEYPSALQTVIFINELLAESRKGLMRVFEPFVGTAQVTSVFNAHGYIVEGCEYHEGTFRIASNNLKLAGHSEKSRIHNKSGVDHLEELIRGANNVDIVYLDPPWEGNYKYDVSKPFSLLNMKFSGFDLIAKCRELNGVKLIALKLPTNYLPAELEKICVNHKCHGTVHNQLIRGFPREACQSTSYFYGFGDGSELKIEDICIESDC